MLKSNLSSESTTTRKTSAEQTVIFATEAFLRQGRKIERYPAALHTQRDTIQYYVQGIGACSEECDVFSDVEAINLYSRTKNEKTKRLEIRLIARREAGVVYVINGDVSEKTRTHLDALYETLVRVQSDAVFAPEAA